MTKGEKMLRELGYKVECIKNIYGKIYGEEWTGETWERQGEHIIFHYIDNRLEEYKPEVCIYFKHGDNGECDGLFIKEQQIKAIAQRLKELGKEENKSNENDI